MGWGKGSESGGGYCGLVVQQAFVPTLTATYAIDLARLLCPSANQHVLGPYVRSAPGCQARGQGDRLA